MGPGDIALSSCVVLFHALLYPVMYTHIYAAFASVIPQFLGSGTDIPRILIKFTVDSKKRLQLESVATYLDQLGP